MKYLKYLSSLTLCICGLILFTGTGKAQDIRFYNGAGQEVNSAKPFPQDRVSRGENYTVTVSSPGYPILIRLRADNGYVREWKVSGKFVERLIVPRDPSFDNAVFSVFNPTNWYCLNQRRLPIGRK
jgi:hypothetical protein